jgi:hypothetical protein
LTLLKVNLVLVPLKCKIFYLTFFNFFSPGVVSKVNKNIAKVTRAVKVAPELSKILLEELEGATKIGDLIKNTEKLKDVNEIGKKAHEKKWEHAYDIVWNSIKAEERVGKSGKDAKALSDHKKLAKKAVKDLGKKKKGEEDAQKKK